MSSITQIVLNDDEILVKQTVKQKEFSPNYLRVGNGTMNKQKIESIPLVSKMLDMTFAERWLITTIIEGITWDTGYNPVVKISKSSLTRTNQDNLVKGYKLLSSKNLVKRIKNGHYMINPNALIPVDYKSALTIWESVKP